MRIIQIKDMKTCWQLNMPENFITIEKLRQLIGDNSDERYLIRYMEITFGEEK